MSAIVPHKDENPLAFVECANALEVPEKLIDAVLKEHFDISDDGEIKRLKLRSEVFWEQFYLNHVSGIHERGGSRYAALKFIQRKNGQAGQKKLSDEQIEVLVDSAGSWQR